MSHQPFCICLHISWGRSFKVSVSGYFLLLSELLYQLITLIMQILIQIKLLTWPECTTESGADQWRQNKVATINDFFCQAQVPVPAGLSLFTHSLTTHPPTCMNSGLFIQIQICVINNIQTLQPASKANPPPHVPSLADFFILEASLIDPSSMDPEGHTTKPNQAI